MGEPHNPWLRIPLVDYENHMEGVGQLAILSELFGEALEMCRPRSVAILGVAGGNGIERLNPALTTRVVGIDINRTYLAELNRRYGVLPGLELYEIDLAAEALDCPPVELVHAALIFEHAGIERCLENAQSLMASGGRLSVILQEPGNARRIGRSQYESIRALQRDFSFLDSASFCSLLEARGLRLVSQTRRPIPSAGRFWMGVFG